MSSTIKVVLVAVSCLLPGVKLTVKTSHAPSPSVASTPMLARRFSSSFRSFGPWREQLRKSFFIVLEPPSHSDLGAHFFYCMKDILQPVGTKESLEDI